MKLRVGDVFSLDTYATPALADSGFGWTILITDVDLVKDEVRYLRMSYAHENMTMRPVTVKGVDKTLYRFTSKYVIRS